MEPCARNRKSPEPSWKSYEGGAEEPGSKQRLAPSGIWSPPFPQKPLQGPQNGPGSTSEQRHRDYVLPTVDFREPWRKTERKGEGRGPSL